VPPVAAVKLSWGVTAIWLPLGIALGLLVGGAAAVVETYFAPLVLFPLLTGAILGAALIGLMRWSDVAHRPSLITTVVLSGLACVFMQHYVAYLTFWREQVQQAPERELARQAFPENAPQIAGRQPPQDFVDYMQREAQQGRVLTRQLTARGTWAWVSWGIDAVLLLAAAMALVVPALRLPYCNCCLSWYRTTRSGRIPPATARQLAGIIGQGVAPRAVAPRYRLLSCESGCGPTGLELAWRIPKKGIASTVTWLDAAQRSAVVAILDAAPHDNDQGR
jgi:hypothetical protein